ncbi:effector-associated constant component EACC1 [Actinoallomurus sp. CA-150999]|uniref:effector-associated constant component EACC1 n=1 Tax=Actinoallomurus sp. CA-150999 TaxID=3239887 RepID=UPI003D922DE8
MPGTHGVELAFSDPAEFLALRRWLERAPGVRVEQRAGTPLLGEQGAWDVLIVLASGSGVLAAALQTLPEFIRSRRANLIVTLKTEGKELTLEATNIAQAESLIESFLK